MILFIATAFAAEPDAPISSEVNPTVKYLTEQFSAAVEKGLPLASSSVQEIANQIHYLGLGLLAYDSFLIALSALVTFLAYKLFTGIKDDMEEPESEARFTSGIVGGLVALVMFIGGLNGVSEHIKMTAAPMVWALQEMM